MSIKVVFLGTAGAVPTKKRSLPAVLLQRGNEQILFDCGEGVQRQMIKAKVGFHKKLKILISHLHGDHVLGLPGLLQTMALLDRQHPVQIYGPPGIDYYLKCLKESLQFDLTFPVEIKEFQESGIVHQEKEYKISAVKSNHVVFGFSYALIENPRPGKFYPKKARDLGVEEGEEWGILQSGVPIKLPDGTIVKPEEVTGPPRKGRKVVYSGDTRPYDEFPDFAENADLLIHESTFDDELSDKAMEDGHSTPRQAALQAQKSDAKALVLTHISARYAENEILLEQAKKVFKNVRVAEDFLVIDLPLQK